MRKRIIGESLAKTTGQRAREGKESLQAVIHIWHLWIESVKAGELGRKNFNLHFIAVLRVSSRPVGSPWAMTVQQLSYVGKVLCGSGTTATLRHRMEADGKKHGFVRNVTVVLRKLRFNYASYARFSWRNCWAMHPRAAMVSDWNSFTFFGNMRLHWDKFFITYFFSKVFFC